MTTDASLFWFRHQMGLVVFLGILLIIAVTNLLALRQFSRSSASLPSPRVSILVPVRNEEAVLLPSLRSLLAQEYPDFEVLVLDDHSSDGTLALLGALAQSEPRLTVLRGRPLPPGWMGKHWACQQLAQQASGELLLFTDADTLHRPQALRQGVAALLESKADLLSAFLHQEMRTLGEKLSVSAVFWCFFCFLPLGLAFYLPIPGLSLTNGQWMLFRRSAYFDVGGHAAVRQNPVDDIALGRRIKAMGLRWRVGDASEFVSCRMYQGLCLALEGFSKNMFAVFDFRLLPYLFVWSWIFLLTFEPLAIVSASVLGWNLGVFTFWPSLLAVVQMALLWFIFSLRFRFPLYLVLFYPLCLSVLIFIAFRSLWLALRGQATWKQRTLPRPKIRLL